MPLHDRDEIRRSPDADIFGTDAADSAVPKYRMPEHGMRPDVAHALVRDELFLDGSGKPRRLVTTVVAVSSPIEVALTAT